MELYYYPFFLLYTNFFLYLQANARSKIAQKTTHNYLQIKMTLNRVIYALNATRNKLKNTEEAQVRLLREVYILKENNRYLQSYIDTELSNTIVFEEEAQQQEAI